jgi:surfeit locus 1 family protein
MHFKPSLGLTATLLIIGFLFGRLGFWQLERQEEKQQLFDQFENAPSMAIEQALKMNEGFSRVEAFGHYDDQRHILLDNRILNGRAGVHVLTPFILSSGRRILVNRGWLPLPPDRRGLPPVHTDSASRVITGIMKKPVTGGHRLGDPDVLVHDKWPQLITYFDLDSISSALEAPLEPWLLQLDIDDPSGFAGRQWKAAVMEPKVHRAYALQWFSLMLATFIIWVTLGIRGGQQNRNQAKGSRK